MVKLLVLFGISLPPALVYAQNAFTAHDGNEHLLAPFQWNRGAWIFMQLKEAPNLACGNYFILVGGKPTFPDGKAAPVFFLLDAGEGLAGPMRVGRDQFRVVVGDKTSKLTATYVAPGIGEHVPAHWTIRISPQDYGVARPCLPDAVTQVPE